MAIFPYKLNEADIESSNLNNYIQMVLKAQKSLEVNISPILDPILSEFEEYAETLEHQKLDINYSNPLIHTNKAVYILYMLLINYANQFWKESFENTSKKIIVLPRCLTGPNFDLLEVKRTKVGWHEIVGTQNTDYNAWVLTQISKTHDFEVYITMGNRFKEPNFMRVFGNLRKKFGNFGLIAVACIPELALGNTYIMEMGIPSHAIPLFFSGCEKWHGSKAIKTEFPLTYILELLSIK